MSARLSSAFSLSSLSLVACTLSSCGGDDGAEDVLTTFDLKTLPHSVASTTPLLLNSNWLVYVADESTTGVGTNLNDNGTDVDTIDSVPIRYQTQKKKATNLGVALSAGLAQDEAVALVGSTIFMIVDEAADGIDWDGDLANDDQVLLYHLAGDPAPVYLDTLAATGAVRMAVAGSRVFYVSDETPAALGDTNLYVTTVTDSVTPPTVPLMVNTNIADPNNDGVSVSILKEDEEFLFLTMDENVDGELNDDIAVDGTDTHVLAVLDGKTGGAQVLNTELALDGPTSAVRARFRNNNWLVAFLVSETAQDANLNDPALFGGAWIPTQCTLTPDDLDTTDHVLHWLDYTAFLANQITAAPTNTGLVGTLGEKVYVHYKSFVGVASLEADEGFDGGCDLNADGDITDRIFRWTEAAAGALPIRTASRLHALIATVPGLPSADSTGGVVVLEDFWAILVNESDDNEDIDGDGNRTRNILGVHDPANTGTFFNFNHGGGAFVSATWMAQDPRGFGQFFLAFEEDGFFVNGDAQGNMDGDLNDSVPTFPERETGSTLKFPGFGVAVTQDNAGIIVSGGYGFYRVSEDDEERDVNDDGDKDDYILQRIKLSGGETPAYMGTLNDLPRSAVSFQDGSGAKAAALIVDESMQGAAGKDFNKDGDRNDFAVRIFRMPE